MLPLNEPNYVYASKTQLIRKPSPFLLFVWVYLFTVVGFPLHEAAHAFVYQIQSIPFTMTLNHVHPDIETVLGLLFGPAFTLLLGLIGLLAIRIAQRKTTPPGWTVIVIGLALGQLINRPPLQLAMLFLGVNENDEPMAAKLLGVHPAVVIVPSFLLFSATLIAVIRRMRRSGFGYGSVGLAVVATACGVGTILYLDQIVFGQ